MSGVFGVISQKDCVEDLFYGTDYQSHMGTERAGLAVLAERFQRAIHDISQGQFKSRFDQDYREMKGKSGIGVISDRDPQPLIIGSRFGTFAIVMAGMVTNAAELAAELQDQGHSFVEMSNGTVNSVELVAKLINKGKDLPDGIERMGEKIKGSASLLLLGEDGIYAARDRMGRTPLVIAQREGDLAVALESCAFSNLGFEIKRELGPGEIVLLKENITQLRPPNQVNQICAFLWIYTGYPASAYEGITVEAVRERCGEFLAKRDNVEADLVAGVPDSGTTHAIGYARQKGWPYRRPLVKYSAGYGRSYTPPSQEVRDLVAKMKLIAIKDIIQGNRIILCEDSIVRGTQLRNLTVRKLWGNEAKEIHIRPACPPLMFPCIYLLSTRSIHELAARRAIRAIEGRDIDNVGAYLDHTSENYQKMAEWIRDDLGVTSLRYQTLEDMIAAIGLPREKLCTYCWTGE